MWNVACRSGGNFAYKSRSLAGFHSSSSPSTFVSQLPVWHSASLCFPFSLDRFCRCVTILARIVGSTGHSQLSRVLARMYFLEQRPPVNRWNPEQGHGIAVKKLYSDMGAPCSLCIFVVAISYEFCESSKKAGKQDHINTRCSSL